VVRGAMNAMRIDRERDAGVLIDPNVWMMHAIDG
jgi:hypothetical protein